MQTWPIKNRGDSLTIDFFYLQRIVGQKIGYGYNPATWTDLQTQEVQEIIDEGCRMYYFPPPLQPPYVLAQRPIVHEWSFMRPIWQFDTTGDVRHYPLPENFERPIGNITYANGDNDYYEPIRFTSTQRTLELENRQDYTAPPCLASIQPVDSVGTTPQTLQLTLHPTPDATYKLNLQYQCHARRLGEDNPFPLGGQMHGPGVLASCEAVAEYRKMGGQGPAFAMFMQRLAGNIARDEERGASYLGYNGNGGGGTLGRGTLRSLDGVYLRDTLFGNTAYTGQ